MDISTAEGWFDDPYGVHQHRWFSAGRPSALVRDDGAESNDPPPAASPTVPLHRVDAPPSSGGDDLIRAGDTESVKPHDAAMGTWGTIPHN